MAWSPTITVRNCNDENLGVKICAYNFHNLILHLKGHLMHLSNKKFNNDLNLGVLVQSSKLIIISNDSCNISKLVCH